MNPIFIFFIRKMVIIGGIYALMMYILGNVVWKSPFSLLLSFLHFFTFGIVMASYFTYLQLHSYKQYGFEIDEHFNKTNYDRKIPTTLYAEKIADKIKQCPEFLKVRSNEDGTVTAYTERSSAYDRPQKIVLKKVGNELTISSKTFPAYADFGHNRKNVELISELLT